MTIDRRTFLSLGAALTAGVLAPGMLWGCSTTQSASEVEDDLPHNSYDWDNLKVDSNELRSYVDADGVAAFRGVDLSNHDTDIDWDGFVDDGISFVMLRVGYRGYTEGGLFDDDTFQTNYDAAIEHGIDVGIYFFSQALSVAEAQAEAEFVYERIKDLKITYPVAYDLEKLSGVEDRAEALSSDQATQNTIAFCDKIAAWGYTPIVYGNSFWFTEDVDLRELTTRYDIWLAEYDEKPDFVYEFTMWQYSESGEDDTTYGKLDLDLCFKDYAAASGATSGSASASASTSASGSASASASASESISASGSASDDAVASDTSGSASGSAAAASSSARTATSDSTASTATKAKG